MNTNNIPEPVAPLNHALLAKDALTEAVDFLAGISSADLKSKAQGRIADTSSWFRLRTNVRIGTAEFVLYSVLFREQSQKVRTVQRSFGSE